MTNIILFTAPTDITERYNMNRLLRFHLPKLVVLVAIFAFIDRVFDMGVMQVDWIAIGLLLVIILAPFATQLRKFTFGDFGFELDKSIEKMKRREAQRGVKKESQQDRSQPTVVPKLGYAGRAGTQKPDAADPNDIGTKIITRTLYSKLEESPHAAIVRLRTIIAWDLAKLAKAEGLEFTGISTSRMANELSEEGILSDDLLESVLDIISLCDEALDGSELSHRNAIQIINIGINVLSKLQMVYMKRVVLPAEDEMSLTKEDLREYQYGTYQVKTVIPTVENPKLIIRQFDQEALDAFLEGYNEVAEFIVSVSEVDSPTDDEEH